MILRALITSALLLQSPLAAELGAQGVRVRSELTRRQDPPSNLLEGDFSWECATGDWRVGAGKAAVIAGETMMELAARKSMPLNGRWLSMKVGIAGAGGKAGIWFSGVRDEQGQMLRFAVESASRALTNGRGRTLAALARVGTGADLIFTFGGDRVTVHHAGSQVAEVPITYAEAEATVSLFAERGEATFTDMLLAGELLGASPSAAVVAAVAAPKAPRMAAHAPAEKVMSVDFTTTNMVALKSGWNAYFGVHFDTAPGPWHTVRHYDGPEFGMPPRDRHTGDVKTFVGPFTQQQVQSSLADFRDWRRKDARGLEVNIPALIEADQSALFIAPWASPFTPVQQDQVWALMKLVYGGFVGAEGRIFFQWGDEINYRRLGTAANARVLSAEPRGGVSPQRGANQPADAAAYVENYFAPAIEAVRRASEDIFHDPRRIPVMLGSCVRASSPENRAWYMSVLEHQIEGTNAPSLKGSKVVDVVDYLTVNYPFHGADDAGALRELWERYGTKVKGLWVTEELGCSGRGSAALIQTIAQYLDWVGSANLDATQTKLFWYLPVARREPNDVSDLVRLLGSSMGNEPLKIAHEPTDTGQIFRVAAGEGRLLVIHVPDDERRARRPAVVSEMKLSVTAEQAARPWVARLIETRERRLQQREGALPVEKKDGQLVVATQVSSGEPFALLVETP